MALPVPRKFTNDRLPVDALEEAGSSLRDGLRASAGKAGAEVATAVIARSDYARLARLTAPQRAELRKLCERFLEPEMIDGPMRMLTSGSREVRRKGFEMLEAAVGKALRRGGRDLSGDAMVAAIEKVGLSALLFDPHFAYRWRQHAAAAQKAGKEARSFAAFVSDRKNRDLMKRIVRRIGRDQLQRFLPELTEGVVSRAAWSLKSSSVQRNHVIAGLEDARRALGDEAFFRLAFGKVRHLIPEGGEAEIRKAIKDRLRTGKAPDPLRKDGLDKVFDAVDPGAMQAGLGEALAARKLLETAGNKAEELGETVYVLLGNQVAAQRNLAPRRMPKGKTSVAADQRMHTGEAADALVVTVNDSKQIRDRIAAETKTSGRPAEQVVEQVDNTRETIEVAQARIAEAVFRVDKTGTRTALSLEEAAEELGGSVQQIGKTHKRPALTLQNEPGYADKVIAARKSFEDSGGIGPAPEELKLLAEGKFQRTKSTPKRAYAGTAQAEKMRKPDTPHRRKVAAEADRRGVEFDDYGAEYEAVRDVAMDILSDTRMTR